MFNLLEYSKNYSKTSGSLWNCYRDELTDETNDDNDPIKNVIISKSFKYKTSITGSTYNVPRRIRDKDGNLANDPDYDQDKKGTKEVEISAPLKHLRNFWNSLNIPLFNCKISLAYISVITSMGKKILEAGQPNRSDSPINATFIIRDC